MLRTSQLVKAIWLLYRRAKWKYLIDLGLNRTEAEARFHEFDMEYITAEHGRITTQQQVSTLIRMYPAILPASVNLLGAFVKGTYLE